MHRRTQCCIDFKNLGVGRVYRIGETFTSSKVPFTVMPFKARNGHYTKYGHVHSWYSQRVPGYTGRHLSIGQAQLTFGLGRPIKVLSLYFTAPGDFFNIMINSTLRTFRAFTELHDTSIDGVVVAILDRQLQLEGMITEFAIGGRDLWIEDVCFERLADEEPL